LNITIIAIFNSNMPPLIIIIKNKIATMWLFYSSYEINETTS